MDQPRSMPETVFLRALLNLLAGYGVHNVGSTLDCVWRAERKAFVVDARGAARRVLRQVMPDIALEEGPWAIPALRAKAMIEADVV